MRYVVYGAGAVGGVIGGRLAESGHNVVLIARGAHCEAIQKYGLEIQSPAGNVTVKVPAVEHPSEISFAEGDVVILTMKTQDTDAALNDLRDAAGTRVPVVCAQNGVENERLAARRFERVYAVPVRLPATHLDPGVVQADSSPVSGILDVGCYPSGVDDLAGALSAALEASTFSSRPEPRVMRHKYQKLLMNLGNAIGAVCGPGSEARDLARRAREEALACYRAAGIDSASDEEDRARRGSLITVGRIGDRPRPGSSTWQSLARGKRSIEVDWLNGEIVLLGRLHGVPTPVNAALQRVANEMARNGRPPGSMRVEELERAVG
jgi:2-dehydropantoate 2-reductase